MQHRESALKFGELSRGKHFVGVLHSFAVSSPRVAQGREWRNLNFDGWRRHRNNPPWFCFIPLRLAAAG
jgi:hypothetical protein